MGEVVTEQPTKLDQPREWSTGMVNFSCCLASFIPCLTWAWACSNASRVGQPGLCASQAFGDKSDFRQILIYKLYVFELTFSRRS